MCEPMSLRVRLCEFMTPCYGMKGAVPALFFAGQRSLVLETGGGLQPNCGGSGLSTHTHTHILVYITWWGRKTKTHMVGTTLSGGFSAVKKIRLHIGASRKTDITSNYQSDKVEFLHLANANSMGTFRFLSSGGVRVYTLSDF